MSHQDHDSQRRLSDLLADRASQGLDNDQTAELAELLASTPDARLLEAQYDGVVAALASGVTPEPLDPAFRARLAEQGRAIVGAHAPQRSGRPPNPPSPGDQGDLPPQPIPFHAARPGASPGPSRWLSGLGWLVAAAALALAAIAWWPAGHDDNDSPTVAQQRTALERDARDAVAIVLTSTDHPTGAGVVADIIWSDTRQQGYLRIRGLAPNDPALAQYQVWITDATRRDDHPISAGVFDLADSDYDPVTRQAIIPLDPSLPIGRAVAFSVTIETPGGVVVSARERLLLNGRVG